MFEVNLLFDGVLFTSRYSKCFLKKVFVFLFRLTDNWSIIRAAVHSVLRAIGIYIYIFFVFSINNMLIYYVCRCNFPFQLVENASFG